MKQGKILGPLGKSRATSSKTDVFIETLYNSLTNTKAIH